MDVMLPKDENKKTLDILEAIYSRHATRKFLTKKIDRAIINQLLDAANHAPSALHQDSRGYVVIQNKPLLNRLSDSAKNILINEDSNKNLQWEHVKEVVRQKEFNIFYNAPTLIVIYSTIKGPFVSADCWLAAQNLMLAALPFGLGSCVIGFAVPALNLPEWKKELDIPSKMTAVAPIILGWPSDKPLSADHPNPLILKWT